MSNQPSFMFDKHLIERIDACRPASADHHDPALGDAGFVNLAAQLAEDPQAAALFARVQAIDGRVASALENLAVPPDLAARLLAHLAEAADAERQRAAELLGAMSADWSPPASQTAEVPGGPPVASALGTDSCEGRLTPSDLATPRPQSAGARGVLSRRVIWQLTATAAALAIVAGAVWYWPAEKPFGAEQLDLALRQFYEQDAGGEARLLIDHAPPATLPASRFVLWVEGPHVAWRPVERLLGRRGLAYELQSPEGIAATLYVVPLKASLGDPELRGLLPTQPPERPLFTGGLVTSVWREGPLAYLLVIRGTERSYRQFVAPPSAVARVGGGRLPAKST